jgi:hypothetical protein
LWEKREERERFQEKKTQPGRQTNQCSYYKAFKLKIKSILLPIMQPQKQPDFHILCNKSIIKKKA